MNVLVNIKTHNNHYATCLCCKHLDIGEDGPYSELTPGAGFYVACGKGCFETMYGGSVQDMHQLQTKAQECNEFSPSS